jgi:raffinose/stachyose/melibiose transport system substrate-binding protein
MAKKAIKALSVLATVGILTLSLAACGGNNSKNSNNGNAASPSASSPAVETSTASQISDEKVTITFQNIYPDETTPTAKAMHLLVDQYTKLHPNVTIELDILNTDQQKQKLKVQAASKEVPDITMVNPAAQMKPFVDAGLFAPLNDVLDKNGLKDTYLTGLLDNYSFNGNVYAIPDGSNIEVVFYNKDLFKEAGINAIPTTFDELVADVKLLKAKGITPMAIGEKDSWTGSFLFMNILLRTNGGPGFLKDVVDGSKTFADPAFTTAVDKFQELVKAGAFADGATSIDYDAGRNLFTSGKAGIYVMGSWDTGAIDSSSVAGKVGAFQFPTVDGKGDPNEFMLAPGTAFALSANSKHLDVAKDFLNFYTLNLPKTQFDLKNTVGQPQKYDGDMKAAGYSDLAIDVSAMFQTVKGGDLAFDNTMNPAVAQVHLNSLQNLFVKQVDSAEVAKEHQNAFEANK